MSKSARPTISIVTPALNAAATIERCLDSVRAQGSSVFEHIVIDGGSRDGTVNILALRADDGPPSLHFTSEPDDGIADAFNKGIRRARGEWIGLLNADDWYEPGVIERLTAHMDREHILHGRMRLHDPATGASRETNRRGYRLERDFRPLEKMPAQHPTCFVPRSVYEQVGLFDTSFRVAMDYDLLLRAHLAGVAFEYQDEVVVNFALRGVSGQDPYRGLREVLASQILHRDRVFHPVRIYTRTVFNRWRRKLRRRLLRRPIV